MEADSLTTKGFSTEQITTVQEAWSEPGRERDNGANELAQGGKSAEGNTETSRTVVDSSNGHSPSTPPPLPPRPNTTHLSSDLRQPPTNFLKDRSTSFRPRLQTYTTTTKVSFTDVVTHALPDGTRDTFASTAVTSNAESASVVSTPGKTGLTQEKDANSEVGDSESRRSYAPTIQTDGDVESLLGEVLRVGQPPQLSHHLLADSPFNVLSDEDEDLRRRLEEEFMISDEQEQDWRNEGALQQRWKSRLKHFLILSSAGKPIYSRHGEDSLISEYIGVVQTIISSFQDANDSIKGFTAGNVVFVILAQGPLYLVAISHLQESETQLLAQLEALYMQILSTLTLPSLTSIFSHRPSTDLRKPLQGTEALLSALADAFTRGSPATLLSALECLRIRKAQRTVIESTLLKTKVPSLLYGLIVAGGRLVSVIRPRRHSLHPSDLQLIFNMLFEAGRVKVGEGENWIPLCLPAFNNRGYLYMYVSFLVDQPEDERSSADTGEKEDQVAVLLISAEKESFYELKRMRDNLVEQLQKNGSLAHVRSAVRRGRPSATDLAPGIVIRHFLYKSRSNVQFVMPSFSPSFDTPFARRKLLSLYHTLHASVHAKNTHLKVHHSISRDAVSLGWVTPIFELYCVAGPNATKSSLAQGANKVIQWIRREEQRLFIIGGAVF